MRTVWGFDGPSAHARRPGPAASVRPSRNGGLLGASLTLLLLLPVPLQAKTWYDSYHKGLEAVEREDWNEAVRYINEALKENPRSSAQARTYGMRYVEYFPFLQLGIAYYHLGQPDAALQAFETEERQAQIALSETASEQLQTHRDRIQRDKRTAAAGRSQLVQQLVSDNLATAQRLEEEGRLEDALSALDRALAVAPDHPQASSARERLLGALAKQERAQEEEQRFTALVARGRAELASGAARSAAATLSEAFELRNQPDVAALLERAREAIHAGILEQGNSDERRRLVDEALSRAGKLEAAGELGESLRQLQSVFALDPGNSRAHTLQERIVRARQAGEAEARSATIRRLLVETRELLDTGAHEQALRKANRVLALEPANADALGYLTEGYSSLSNRLLGANSSAPAILFNDLREDRPGEGRLQIVTSRVFTLTGTVYNDSPVELVFEQRGQPDGTASVQAREFQGLWITEFRSTHRLEPGVTTIGVKALERGGAVVGEEYSVEYVAPFLWSGRFFASLAALLACVGLALLARRSHRRRRLLRRRFNPYIAGAPVLEAERYYGREELLDYVLRRLQNNSIMLYGERRIGKTSFQHRLKRRLTNLDDPHHEFHPVFIDLQGTTEDRFFATLAEEIFQELAPLLGDIQKSPLPDDDGYGHRSLVRDIQRVIGALEKRTRKKVKLVLLIDEVDELNSYDPRVNQKLRSLFMRSFAESLVSVVSGVGIRKHWEREGSPWYNFFQEVEIEPLDSTAAASLVEAPVRDVFSFDDGVQEEILRRTGRKPYLIQRLCSEIVDHLHQEGRNRFTMRDVEIAGQRDNA